MFSKIYEKIITFIKEEYKYLIFCSIILFLGLFHLPYSIYVGGGIINLEKRLEVEGEKELKGSLNLAYVKSLHATIPSYLLSYVFDWERESIEKEKIDEEESTKDIWNRELLYLKEANDSAIIAAYHLANEKIDIHKEVLKVLYVDKDSDTDLKVNDTIISIDDIHLKEFSEIKDIISKYNVGDRVKVRYLRNDKEYDGYFILRMIDNEKKVGLYLIKLYDYTLSRNVKFNFTKNEGGPSGGFMTSLAIYTKLIGKDLTNGLKIVGSGTISSDGKIGEIGGIKYKLAGAERNKADIFFACSNNYEEAMKIKQEKNYQVNVIKVDTLEEAVKYLESR